MGFRKEVVLHLGGVVAAAGLSPGADGGERLVGLVAGIGGVVTRIEERRQPVLPEPYEFLIGECRLQQDRREEW